MVNRILYIANVRIPSEKGGHYDAVKMCEAFQKSGVEVHMVAPRRIQTNKSFRQVKSFWEYYGIEKKFRITRLPCIDLLWLDPYLPNFIVNKLLLPFRIQAWSFAICAAIYALFQPEKIVYSRDVFSTILLVISRPVHGKRIYHEAHDASLQIGTRWIAGRKVNGLIVLTHKLKELHAKKGMSPRNIIVVPEAVDLDKFRQEKGKGELREMLGLPVDARIVGYVGQLQTMGMEKGLIELIRAMKIVRGQFKDAVLCIVGGPDTLIPKYAAIAEEEGLGDNVIFTGQVPTYRVPLYTGAFDICAMPFPRTEHYTYYMSPIKLFEYMASARPVIATDLPSVREIVGEDDVVLVEPEDVEALARGIKKVLGDPEFARRIAENACRVVQEYTWEKRARRIKEFIGLAVPDDAG